MHNKIYSIDLVHDRGQEWDNNVAEYTIHTYSGERTNWRIHPGNLRIELLFNENELGHAS